AAAGKSRLQRGVERAAVDAGLSARDDFRERAFHPIDRMSCCPTVFDPRAILPSFGFRRRVECIRIPRVQPNSESHAPLRRRRVHSVNCRQAGRSTQTERSMKQLKIPAVFMRGGTSNAVVFHAKDLPADRAQWDEIFLAAIGSPDPYGRQLDGMGGGVSSLSKVCVIGPSTRPDADIDYTFAQVQVKEAKV